MHAFLFIVIVWFPFSISILNFKFQFHQLFIRNRFKFKVQVVQSSLNSMVAPRRHQARQGVRRVQVPFVSPKRRRVQVAAVQEASSVHFSMFKLQINFIQNHIFS